MPSPNSAASPTTDVVGIGNALVDVISHESHEFIAQNEIEPGSMNLVESDRSAAIYAQMGPGVEISGGSAANTMVGVASFGGSAHYLGRVKDDQLGRVFAHDITTVGVNFTNPLAVDGPPTGSCLVLVTPDAERTMNTHLGASSLFGPDDVDLDVVRSGGILYLEGYLFDRPEAQAAFKLAAAEAHAAGRQVSLTLSDSFCVDRHRDAFRDLVEHHVDLVFANEDEICSLYEVGQFDDVVPYVRAAGALAALTRSEKGSVVVSADGEVEVSADPVAEVVDTTGAGDLYAAGFLYGQSRGMDDATCARLGSIAAAEVISHIGARPEQSLAALATARGVL